MKRTARKPVTLAQARRCYDKWLCISYSEVGEILRSPYLCHSEHRTKGEAMKWAKMHTGSVFRIRLEKA